jgi:CRISPR/Cas system CMR-associated protein Cmr5 small subunit
MTVVPNDLNYHFKIFTSAQERFAANKKLNYVHEAVGKTGFSWHIFHFLIFYNFHTNDTKKKRVLVALSFFDYARKYNEEVISITNPRKMNFF